MALNLLQDNSNELEKRKKRKGRKKEEDRQYTKEEQSCKSVQLWEADLKGARDSLTSVSQEVGEDMRGGSYQH